MSETETSVDWRKLREFADVDLEKSYILSWRVEGSTLMVELDVFLTEKHPFFEKPRPSEKVCIRPAVIEFPHCESIRSRAATNSESIADVAAGLGLGAIGSLSRMHEGPFEISGEFGTVQVDAERPILRLRSP